LGVAKSGFPALQPNAHRTFTPFAVLRYE